MLSGILEVDGAVMPDRRVLLVSDDMNHLLASATTDENGVFQFPLSNRPSTTKAVLLAKVQGPVLAIAHRPIDIEREGLGSYRLSIDTMSDQFHTVYGRIDSNEIRPPYVLLHVDPVHVAGIPAPLEKFFKTVDEQVIESWFFQQRIAGDSFEVRLQQGSYLVDVHYFSKSQPAGNRDVASYMREISVDGEEGRHTFQAPFTGYLLNVDRDRRLNITIAPIRIEQQ